MIVPLIGPYAPVAPVAPVARVVRKRKAAERSVEKQAATHAARPPAVLASHSTRTALDEIKLGG
jgi:hypothetical protein